MTITPRIAKCKDDGSDADLGRTWVVDSDPFALPPLGIRTQLQGLIGERPDDGNFWWEAYHDCRDIGEEHYAEGYAPTFDAAVAAIVSHWETSPVASCPPYTGRGFDRSRSWTSA